MKWPVFVLVLAILSMFPFQAATAETIVAVQVEFTGTATMFTCDPHYVPGCETLLGRTLPYTYQAYAMGSFISPGSINAEGDVRFRFNSNGATIVEFPAGGDGRSLQFYFTTPIASPNPGSFPVYVLPTLSTGREDFALGDPFYSKQLSGMLSFSLTSQFVTNQSIQIPEPASWLLLSVGFGCLCASARSLKGR